MIQRVYCTYTAFEEIMLFNEDYKKIYDLFLNYSEIAFDLEDAELERKANEDSFLKAFIKRMHISPPRAVKYFFEGFEEQPCDSFCRDIVILEMDIEYCREYRQAHGVLVISKDELKAVDIIFKHGKWIINKDEKEVMSHQGKITLLGWEAFFPNRKFMISPLNALIIADNYILDDGPLGKENLIKLLRSVLPQKLSIPFQVMIVWLNDGSHLKSKETIENLKNEIEEEFKSHSVKVAISIVTTTDKDFFHKRIAFTNYHQIVTDKGFAAFKNDKVKMNNDVEIDGIFASIHSPGSDMEIRWAEKYYGQIVKQIAKNKQPTGAFLIPQEFNVGDCKNRLLNP